MSIISRLGVVLGLDAGEFNKGMGLANKSLTSFATVGNAARLGVVAFAKELIGLADQIDDTAKAFDISVATVVKMNLAMQMSGGSAEGAARSLTTLTNKVDDALAGNEKTRESFMKLGLTLKDLQKLSIDAINEKAVKNLAAMEDGIKRNALAFDVLGKSMRGVDLKAYNAEMEKSNALAESAQEEISSLGALNDEIAASFYKLKVVFMDLFGPVITLVGKSLTFILNLLSDILSVANKIAEGFSKGFKYLTSGQLGKDLRDAKKSQQQLMDEYSGAAAPNFSVSGGANRTAGQTDAQKKITEEINKQNEALNRQVKELQLAARSVGMTKSEYTKLLLEFEKGGKYDKISDVHQRNKLLVEAFKLDKANQDEFIKNEIRKADIAKERFRIEGLMAGQSDTAKQKALEYLQIQEELIEIKRQNLNITDQELAQIAEAKIRMVEMAEASRRANNTFQAGWSTAFENWKEKANDSFSQGEQAFTSMTDSMSNALDQFVETGKISFKSLIADMIKGLIKMQLQAQMSGIFKMIGGAFGFGGGGSGGGGLFNTAPSAGGLALKFADGGDPPVGMASLVGERGPELFVPKTAGTIIPNHQLGSMGGGAQVVYNGPYIANMSAIDTQSGIQFLSKNKETIWSANQSAQRSLPQSR
jgi:phage-related minor tail protein